MSTSARACAVELRKAVYRRPTWVEPRVRNLARRVSQYLLIKSIIFGTESFRERGVHLSEKGADLLLASVRKGIISYLGTWLRAGWDATPFPQFLNPLSPRCPILATDVGYTIMSLYPGICLDMPRWASFPCDCHIQDISLKEVMRGLC